jgi:hypothetical protein
LNDQENYRVMVDKSVSLGRNLKMITEKLAETKADFSLMDMPEGDPKEDFSDLENKMRLRSFDASMKIKMSVYDTYSSSLEDLKFYPYQVVYLEKREEADEPFQAYNENLVHLRVSKFIDGVHYDFNRMDLIDHSIVSVDKTTDTVGDLEKKISEQLGMNIDELIIVLRHESVMNDEVRTEYFNMDWRREKTIDDSSNVIHHSTVLYVEECEKLKAKRLENL